MLHVLASVVRIAVGLVFLGVVTFLFAVACLVCLPSRGLRIRICNVFGHIVGPVILWLAGASVPKGVLERTRSLKPAIYVSNHTSALDIFIGIRAAPTGTVGTAKKEVVWYPFFGQLYAISGHLLVDRQNSASAVQAFKTVAELIHRHNLGVWVWPEGTRARDGRLRPFKKGFVHLALATGLPVVPVVVSNAHQCWRKNSIVMHPTKVDIQVLDPIPTGDWRIETIDKHVAEVWALFEHALPEDQKPLSEPARIAATG